MQRILLLNLLLFVAIFNACTKDEEEEPEKKTDSITYADNIVPILQANCNTCHSASAAASMGSGIVLDTYAALKVYVDNGKFACAVNHDAGCSPMPKDAPQLSSSLLGEINTWLANGALNN